MSRAPLPSPQTAIHASPTTFVTLLLSVLHCPVQAPRKNPWGEPRFFGRSPPNFLHKRGVLTMSKLRFLVLPCLLLIAVALQRAIHADEPSAAKPSGEGHADASASPTSPSTITARW